MSHLSHPARAFLSLCLALGLPHTALAAPSAKTPSPPTNATSGPPALDACKPLLEGGKIPSLTRPPLQSRTTLLCTPGFAAMVSGVTKGPLWVAERLTARSTSQASSNAALQTHPSVPTADQGSPEDYRGTGYDRGQLAAPDRASSQPDLNQRRTMATVLPVAPGLRRGIWSAIDTELETLARQNNAIHIVTGPVFHGEQLTTLGPQQILVPTALWRAVYDPARKGTAVYVCTNQNTPTCTIQPVQALIAETGIDPFPGLPDKLKATAIDLPRPEATPFAEEN